MFRLPNKSVYALFVLLLLPALVHGYQRDPLLEVQLHAEFISLKQADSEAIALQHADRIWKLWFQSGDEEVDRLMQEAMARRRAYDFNGALESINRVIELAPEYPEAWNQRATVHFFQQEYEKSLQDIARTLELEPRHFGALAGRALIRLNQLKPALARQNVIEAMNYHPYLPERKLFPGL